MHLNQIQKKIARFCAENKLESPVEHRLLDTLSELGEVAKEILKMTDYGRKKKRFRPEVKGELGDALYSLVTVANTLNVDLEEALELVLQKYRQRLKKGSAGST